MNGAQIMSSAFLVTWLAASVRLAGPVLLAALGETFSERGGVLNLGIEGTILLGALASFLVSLFTGMTWMALLVAMLVGIIASIFLAWMYVTVKASQVVTGLVFNVLALGIASTVYRRALGDSALPESIAMFHPIHIPLLSDLPFIGPVLFGQTILLYVTLALAVIATFVLFRTNFGLALRACRGKSGGRGFGGNFGGSGPLRGRVDFRSDRRDGRRAISFLRRSVSSAKRSYPGKDSSRWRS